MTGLAAAAVILAACGHTPPPGTAPADSSVMTARDSVRAAVFGAVPDPVGFLLEIRDSLGLSPDQLDQLRAINLDLFRRNSRIKTRIDSIAPPPSPDYAYGRRPPELTPEQRERLQTLVVARTENIRRAREAAYAVLTDMQRGRADQIEQRLRQSRMRGGERRRPEH